MVKHTKYDEPVGLEQSPNYNFTFEMIDSILEGKIDSLDMGIYDDMWRGKVPPHLDQDKKLLLVILIDAIHMVKRYKSSNSKIYRETRDWFLASDNPDYVFSFSSVCESLGISPSYCLKAIRKYL